MYYVCVARYVQQYFLFCLDSLLQNFDTDSDIYSLDFILLDDIKL